MVIHNAGHNELLARARIIIVIMIKGSLVGILHVPINTFLPCLHTYTCTQFLRVILYVHEKILFDASERRKQSCDKE